MKIAVVPARGGSKRVPGKNVRLFAGHPMIAYPVRAALASGLFDRVICSSDSSEIQEAAIKAGAEAPFTRPPELSDDFTPTVPVVLHALEWVEKNWGKVESICCIYATNPFIQINNLKRGYELLKEKSAPCVFPIASFPAPIFRSLKKNSDGRVEMIWPEHELTRSNDLPEAFHDAGQFYWFDAEQLKRNKKAWAKGSVGLQIPRYLVQDIDTLEDWHQAELFYDYLMSQSVIQKVL